MNSKIVDPLEKSRDISVRLLRISIAKSMVNKFKIIEIS